MALTQRLEFRQSQSLVMTPQLMQAIKLLQLSNLDLSTFVEEELERNPLLDRANDGPEAPVAGGTGEIFPIGRSQLWRSGWRLSRRRLRRGGRTEPGGMAEP